MSKEPQIIYHGGPLLPENFDMDPGWTVGNGTNVRNKDHLWSNSRFALAHNPDGRLAQGALREMAGELGDILPHPQDMYSIHTISVYNRPKGE
ncbi:hypothetical protein ACFL2C_03925 [Patescibacteria group bacterium]